MKGTKLPMGTTVRMAMVGCNGEDLDEKVKGVLKDQGLNLLGEASAATDSGMVFTYALRNSFLNVRTWPEKDDTVLAEMSFSNELMKERKDVLATAEKLSQALTPQMTLFEECDMRPRFADPVDCNHGSYMNVERLIHSKRTPYQYLVIAETTDFGRVMALDHAVQTTERANLWYHEPVVQPAMLSHPNPKRVAIVGGGDGGAAHQVLSHPSVEECVMIELDEEVISSSRRELHFIHEGALDDKRVKVEIRNALHYFDDIREHFDVVLLDLTDPVGPAEKLYEESFYHSISRAMTKEGLLATHIGAISQFFDYTPRAYQALQKAFPSTFPYLHHVPDYGCIMGFALCSREDVSLPDEDTIAKRLTDRGLEGRLSLITAKTYGALFALPPVYKRFLLSGERPIGS